MSILPAPSLWFLLRTSLTGALLSSGGAVAGETGAFPLQFDQRSLPVLRGSIGEELELRFLVDTGASRTVLDVRTGRRLGLAPESERRIDALGRTAWVRGVRIPLLRFGPIEARNVPALMADLSKVSPGRRIDAIIGLDLLSLRSFVIDYQRGEITFAAMPEGVPFVPLCTRLPMLGVDASADGRPVRLIVDTAAGQTVLFPSRMGSRLPLFRLRGQVRIPTALASSLAREVDLADLRLGGVKWPRRALLMEGGSPAYDGYDGLLGAISEAMSRVWFDFEHGRLGLERRGERRRQVSSVSIR